MPDQPDHPTRFHDLMAQVGPLVERADQAFDAHGDATKRRDLEDHAEASVELIVCFQDARKLFEQMATLALDAISANGTPETEPEPPTGEPAPQPPPVSDWTEPEPPTIPADPKAPMHTGDPRKYLEPFEAARSVEINVGMTPEQVRKVVLEAECNRPGSLIVLSGGADEALPLLKLGHRYGINGHDGQPLRDVCIAGHADSLHPNVAGVQLTSRSGADTGCGDGVRLMDLTIGASNAGWCVVSQDGAAKTGAHLVGLGLVLQSPEDSKAYGGAGVKWGMLTHETRLTLQDVMADGAFQEHAIYAHTVQGGAYVRGLFNVPGNFWNDQLGKWMPGGCGRTLIQFQARGNEGPMPFGDIWLEDLNARLCGREGLAQHLLDDGTLDPAYAYSAGGGSAITFGSHVQGWVKIRNYRGEGNLCSELAVWPEQAKEGTGFLQLLPTETNPNRIRAYLTGLDGVPFDPTKNEQPAEGYAVPELKIEGFVVRRKKATRQAFLLDALGRGRFSGVDFDGANPATDAEARAHDLRNGFYDWATPCGPLDWD